MTERTSRMPS